MIIVDSSTRPGPVPWLGPAPFPRLEGCGARAAAGLRRTARRSTPRRGVRGVVCGGHGAGVRFAVGVVVVQSGPRTNSYPLRVPCTFLGPTGCVLLGEARVTRVWWRRGRRNGGSPAGPVPSCDCGARIGSMARNEAVSGHVGLGAREALPGLSHPSRPGPHLRLVLRHSKRRLRGRQQAHPIAQPHPAPARVEWPPSDSPSA
jgi:hypothetical protein